MNNERNLYFRACEVAKLYGVNEKTVTRWAEKGMIPCLRTPGGHRRYLRKNIIEDLLKKGMDQVSIDRCIAGLPQ